MKRKIWIYLLSGFLIIFSIQSCAPGNNEEGNGFAVPGSGKTGQPEVTFVELGSVRCIPCRKMQPIMEEIENEYSGQVEVVFHDIWTDEGRPYVNIYGIRVIPTQIFLDKDGIEYFRHEGFFPKEELVKILKLKGVK
jgi:thioredoxin 1